MCCYPIIKFTACNGLFFSDCLSSSDSFTTNTFTKSWLSQSTWRESTQVHGEHANYTKKKFHTCGAKMFHPEIKDRLGVIKKSEPTYVLLLTPSTPCWIQDLKELRQSWSLKVSLTRCNSTQPGENTIIKMLLLFPNSGGLSTTKPIQAQVPVETAVHSCVVRLVLWVLCQV